MPRLSTLLGASMAVLPWMTENCGLALKVASSILRLREDTGVKEKEDPCLRSLGSMLREALLSQCPYHDGPLLNLRAQIRNSAFFSVFITATPILTSTCCLAWITEDISGTVSEGLGQ